LRQDALKGVLYSSRLTSAGLAMHAGGRMADGGLRGARPDPIEKPTIPGIRTAYEEIPADEGVENGAAGVRVESPQPLRLCVGELQPWHFQILAFDTPHQQFARLNSHDLAPETCRSFYCPQR